MIRWICVSIVLLTAAGAYAQDVVEVGVKIAPPFVMEDADGRLTGISIELWERLAAELNLEYQYRRTDLAGLLRGVEAGDYDIGVGALTMTPERERAIDFTHPFHTSGLAIAVTPQESGLWAALRGFLSYEFFAAVVALLALLVAVGFVVWLCERRANAAQFGGSAAQGVGSGLWWAAVTMTTVGYGDKAPATFLGRIVGLIWMFTAIIVISGFTAAIATSLTVNRLAGQVENVDDLRRVRVATVADTTAGRALVARDIAFTPVESVEAALAQLGQGSVDAVVYDAPILKYLSDAEYPKRTTVLPLIFEPQEYAFALPDDSPRRELLNRRILSVLTGDDWPDVLAEYLGGRP